MGIDAIKRWQWILIGLIVGFGLGWTQTAQDPGSGEGRLISQGDFEREIVTKHPKTREPLIKDIVLQPITTDYRNQKVQPVSFQRLQQGAKTGKTIYVPAQFIAQIPYKPEGWDSEKPNLEAYLTEVAQRDKDLHFRYGWYNERPSAIALWTLAGALVVGGIWPTILSLFTGVNLSTPRAAKGEEDYFARFSHGSDPATSGKPAKVVSAADQQRLEEMNATLERDLKDTIQTGKTGEAVALTADQKKAAEVRKLEGGPLEAAPIAKSPDEDDEVEIKGEYYPVMIHHKKHHEDEEPEKDEPKK